jgi:hypothetical protein
MVERERKFSIGGVCPSVARKRAKCRNQILHFMGFMGGVPPNTGTAAVKPRVGIELITKRCLIFVEMAWAGRDSNAQCIVQNAEFFPAHLNAECGMQSAEC